MTWSLDAPVRVGSIAVAAIADTKIKVHAKGSFLFGVAEKRPKMILFASKGQVNAFDPAGRACDVNEVERLYPNAVSRFQVLLRDSP